eukprot:scaffold4036_cov236-Pinguiococcus_pyrenoidosus.AAC.1
MPPENTIAGGFYGEHKSAENDPERIRRPCVRTDKQKSPDHRRSSDSSWLRSGSATRCAPLCDLEDGQGTRVALFGAKRSAARGRSGRRGVLLASR